MPRTALAKLIDRLDLEALDEEIFLGDPGRGEGRLFGGLVAAQALVAAGRTVEEAAPHSLHAYFLRPGAHDAPIHYHVRRIRDGRTFTTRNVVAHQHGEAIFSLATSFCRPEHGISHQDEMPEAPDPEGLPDWEVQRAEMLGNPAAQRSAQPVEVRVCDPDDPFGKTQPPHKRVWLRPCGPLPESMLLHAALLVYASDRTLLSTAARPHGMPWGKRIAASLDHALWFHHEPRFDDWVLYASQSPAAHAARGLIFGAMYRRDGVRIASVAQEGLIRRPR